MYCIMENFCYINQFEKVNHITGYYDFNFGLRGAYRGGHLDFDTSLFYAVINDHYKVAVLMVSLGGSYKNCSQYVYKKRDIKIIIGDIIGPDISSVITSYLWTKRIVDNSNI